MLGVSKMKVAIQNNDKKNTYWCRTENFSGVKKIMQIIQENEKECKKLNFTK